MLMDGYGYFPANGNPKSFKKFVENFKIDTSFSTVKEHKNILALIKAVNDNIDYDIYHIFLIEDYEPYFDYLSALKVNNNKGFIEHMNWIANHISYQDLYRMAKIYNRIEIKYDSIIYNNINNKVVVMNFFE